MADLAAGHGQVWLPEGLARKYPQAPKEWGWQWVFPAESPSADFPVGLVSLSIRVPLEITEGLVRASADRKIKPAQGVVIPGGRTTAG